MIELNKKWDGNKIRVVYDEKGRPNNRVVRRKLARMEGALARSKKEEFGSSREHDDRSVKWLRARQKKNDLSNIQVEDGDTLSKMLPNLEISTPKEEKHDLLGSEKARKDNKGKQIKDFGVMAKSKKTLPNFEISTPQEKEETLDEIERSIREYGDMLDNTMESSDNIVIPIERELFGEEIELGHFSIEKSDLLDICSMDWLSVSCMTTYMKYLCGSFMSSQERYTFANPSNFTNYGNDDGEKLQHLQHILGYVRRNQILLIPYNLGTKLASGQGQFLLSFVSLKEDCKKAQESYARREGRLKKHFAAPHMAYTPFSFMEPYTNYILPKVQRSHLLGVAYTAWFKLILEPGSLSIEPLISPCMRCGLYIDSI
ncbi:hypothetical protein IFM89_004304 [Coptis chinensis]|uniref:Uncharacterized protein n=1 Tax=Coptis chinensis TaxID=261450 RepID=A0A835IAB7_9MAGN|nr:hypothetical protein IFM89_004304 [Coptis chinensis]